MRSIRFSKPVRRLRSGGILLILLLSLLVTGQIGLAQDGDLADRGPYFAGRQTVTVTRPDFSTFTAKLYYPATGQGDNAPYDGGGAPYPAISFGHGYLTNPSYYRSTLEHLATWGYFVIATESGLELFPNHSRYADDLLYALTYLESGAADSASWLYQQVDTAAFGLSGHSMGGGASILAAARDPRVRALANLAAAETNPSAEAAMANVVIPARLLAGSSDSIVSPSTTQSIFNNGAPPRQFALLEGGWHCGFLDSYLLGCDSGPLARSAQLALTRRELTRFFNLHLRDAQPLWRSVWGPERDAEPLVAITAVSGVDLSLDPTGGVTLVNSSHSYTLALTNNSPLAASFTLFAEENGWPISFDPPQTAVLDPAQAAHVTVTVSAPAEAGADTALLSARRDVDGATRGFAWLTTEVIPFTTGAARDGEALTITWATGSADCLYEVHRATTPYFTPTGDTLLATVEAPPYSYTDTTPGILGDPATNYFYVVQALCDETATLSECSGEFDYALAVP